MEQEKGIIKSIGATILECNSDLFTDIGEIGVDFAFDESPLIELPFVKTVFSFAKTGLAIRERHMINKTLKFINGLNSNNIGSKEYENYKKKIENNDKDLYQELEHIVLILDRIIENEKADILANLYSAYVNKKISWGEFKNFSLVLDNFLLYDRVSLSLLYERPRQLKDTEDSIGTTSRLISLGLAYKISLYRRDVMTESISFVLPQNDVAITEFGKKFYECGFVRR